MNHFKLSYPWIYRSLLPDDPTEFGHLPRRHRLHHRFQPLLPVFCLVSLNMDRVQWIFHKTLFNVHISCFRHAGIFILLAGFLTFFFTFIYALKICSETRHAKPGQPGPVQNRNHYEFHYNYQCLFQGELYWTHHWQKSFALPEVVNGKSKTVTAGDSHLR